MPAARIPGSPCETDRYVYVSDPASQLGLSSADLEKGERAGHTQVARGAVRVAPSTFALGAVEVELDEERMGVLDLADDPPPGGSGAAWPWVEAETSGDRIEVYGLDRPGEEPVSGRGRFRHPGADVARAVGCGDQFYELRRLQRDDGAEDAGYRNVSPRQRAETEVGAESFCCAADVVNRHEDVIEPGCR